ncbi:MAG: hypothetical protein L0154_11665 [Chloroflexi bacterium]|nr:hypothetical protein [Chloroflexota bacterium]
MKLPNLENVLIEETKITAYLLSEEKSGGKSAFFMGFGFTIDDWETLRESLIQHASAHEVRRSFETSHGVKYIIEGKMQTPDGRLPQVRSVWIVDTGKDVPRLVTAYPLEEGRS